VNNATETYRIIFNGNVRQDADLDQVKGRLAQLFKVELRVIEKIFREVPYVLLRNQDKDRALRYKQAFEQTGALCRVEAEKPAPRTEKPAATQAGEPAAAGTFYSGEERTGPAM
jgi:hypothetical protein